MNEVEKQTAEECLRVIHSTDIKSRIFTTHDRGMADYILEAIDRSIREHFELEKTTA
jgi:hypothetical protein